MAEMSTKIIRWGMMMSKYKKCGYYSDGECNICGMGMSGEDTFCRLCKDNPNCYYKQLSELKAENERLSSWLASSEKQRMEVCNVIHKKKEQIQTLKYMLFDEKEIPKDKFTMYYRIAQNERRTKSHRDLCTNIVKKYKQTLQEIKEYCEKCKNCVETGDEVILYTIIQKINKMEKE